MPKQPKDLRVAYGSVAPDLMRRIGDAQAAQMGPPLTGDDKAKPATDADRARAWWTRSQAATDEAMMAMATQKYAEHTQAGMDPERAQRATAEDLTHFRYANRLGLYTYGFVGYAEQVSAAQRLAKLAGRTTTPDPLEPAPSMPSAALTNAAAGQAPPMPASDVKLASVPDVPDVPSDVPDVPSDVPDVPSDVPPMTKEVSPDGY